MYVKNIQSQSTVWRVTLKPAIMISSPCTMCTHMYCIVCMYIGYVYTYSTAQFRI